MTPVELSVSYGDNQETIKAEDEVTVVLDTPVGKAAARNRTVSYEDLETVLETIFPFDLMIPVPEVVHYSDDPRLYRLINPPERQKVYRTKGSDGKEVEIKIKAKIIENL